MRIPTDIPVDDLVAWRELVGGSRLADALAKCNERGWGRAAVGGQGDEPAVPNVWATMKAAKRWLEKEPPEAQRDIIRV